MHYRVRYSLDFDLKIRSGQVCLKVLWVVGEGVFLDLVYYVTQVFSYSILNVSVKIVLCLSRNLLFAISYFLFSVFQQKLKEYPVKF